MRYCLFVLFLLFTNPAASVERGWMDQSYEIFMNSKLKKAVTNYRDFPIFWWNFIVVEPGQTPEQTMAFAEQLCARLSEPDVWGVQKLPCNFNLKNIQELAESWIADTPSRKDFPAMDRFDLQWRSTLAKAALPLPREMLEWLRRDPLNELEDLKARLESQDRTNFTRKGGYLIDENSGRVLLPVQFSFPPNHSPRTQTFLKNIQKFCGVDSTCSDVHLFGPHSGTMENETQIRNDVDIVSTVGTIVLVLLVGFIIWTRRKNLLLLFPILAVSVVIAALVTIWVYGSIHAISLSFGPGLIGLALDYGIHASFLDPRSRHTWRSNFMALLTSLVIMVLLGLSSIPLLQQMMFFAVVGLTLSYGLFYLALTKFPEIFMVKSFDLKPKPMRSMEILSVIFLVGAALIFVKPLKLDLQQLNFESAKTVKLRQWFFSNHPSPPPYSLVEDSTDPVKSAHITKQWASEHNVPYHGLANDLPSIQEQNQHRSTWKKFCDSDPFADHAAAERFFPPFINLVCGPRQSVPAYLADLHANGRWLSVFFPKDQAQAALIKERFPEVSSPREVLSEFPHTFAFELAWMLPVALIGAFIFLLFHYRRVSLALLAGVPFLTGIGCFALMTWPLGLPVNFISLMGLLMVFGFSLDYGIFAVDYLLEPDASREGVWSALTLCAVTTVAGFTPMAMAHHPVLNNLGHSLLWGSIGTYIGTFWGVPAGYRWLFSPRKAVV